ncbi:glycosyltransferase [candidate division KSB3 bacterium]|uniref:Glycosyltransferase n=1 Tax=candidate division KSB3 bacterium TaxID=2044937 RepID=A0A9D5JW99_9BACT|nr:glycosyltransferase [candidate division KSB3 bacterium]MBD3325457.1 glycosyltransferase [candidate division KSB3 bacterium]
MKIGIVCWWFNRGQATVGRYLRSVFDQLGHQTYILARLQQPGFDRQGFIDATDVWDQPGVTPALGFEIPFHEYHAWAKQHSPDVILFDQNYQFEEIAKLRALGIKTVGRFVWEYFGEQHIQGAVTAFDNIYSLTRCERERYATWGIESPLLPWGCHPELLRVQHEKKQDGIYFFYPGGYLGQRKPTREVIQAFSQTSQPELRLLIKAQTNNPRKHQQHIGQQEALDPRITVMTGDLGASEYYRLFASCHVCLAPSRWEGLGLHLYEAAAFGMPIITNDNPPMNELVRHGYNGILVNSHQTGVTPSGIPAYDPNIEDLRQAIHAASELSYIEALSQNMERTRDSMNWTKTIDGFQSLLEAPPMKLSKKHQLLRFWAHLKKRYRVR